MKKRIKMMVSSALVGFGLAVLVLPLCLSGMRMLAATNAEDPKCVGECNGSHGLCQDATCEAAGSPCKCSTKANSCQCKK